MIIENEEYRPIIYKGQKTNYYASETGKIYNAVTKHYLTPNTDTSGRYRVCISIHGDCYAVTVHSLVYLAFHGAIPNGMTINHINEDFLDNTYTNLELVTRGRNAQLYRENNGNPDKKYSDMLIVSICKDLKAGIYYKDVAAAYNMPIQYIYNILKGKRRTFISRDYMPFPDSAIRRKAIREIPHTYIDSLILQNYTNAEILELVGLKQCKANDKLLVRSRKKLNYKSPEYFPPEILNQVECLISAGKCNKEIYQIMNMEYNKRNAWMIARARQRLNILDFNPDGVSLDDQNAIIYDIRDGMTNMEIFLKWKLDRTPYTINMMARLRQKVKKMDEEGSTTIESIAEKKNLSEEASRVHSE